MLATPMASVRPCHSSLPVQARTATCALGTGWPLSSEVTHTTDDSAPCLKCATIFVTSAAALT
ncbi:hypothetical protein D3C85_1904610 [compost metagenome]